MNHLCTDNKMMQKPIHIKWLSCPKHKCVFFWFVGYCRFLILLYNCIIRYIYFNYFSFLVIVKIPPNGRCVKFTSYPPCSMSVSDWLLLAVTWQPIVGLQMLMRYLFAVDAQIKYFSLRFLFFTNSSCCFSTSRENVDENPTAAVY